MNPILNSIAAATAEPIKTMVLGTAHEITIRVVEEFATWKKVGYFAAGVLGGGAVIGGGAYVAGRINENSRMKKYMDKRDEERGLKDHEATYIRHRASVKLPDVL